MPPLTQFLRIDSPTQMTLDRNYVGITAGGKSYRIYRPPRAHSACAVVPDKTLEAMALGVLGNVYRDLGQNDKALELFNLELRLRQELGESSGISTSLNRIAGVHSNINDTANAFKYYQQALDLKRDTSTLNNLGELCATTGEFQQAIDFYNEALTLTRKDNDRRGEAAILANIGAFYRQLGELSNALEYYNQALPLARAMNSPANEAAILGHIGRVHLESGRKQEALIKFNRSFQLARGADRFGELSAMINIGRTYFELGNRPRALDFYNRAESVARTINDRLALATIINNRADIFRSRRQFKSAHALYEQALAIVREVGDRSKEVATLGNIAKTQKDMGDLAGARKAIESALDILESLRTKLGSHDLRSSYFAKEHAYYEFEIDLLMELHKRSPAAGLALTALQVSERSRSRSLNEMLVESRVNIRQGVDSQLLDRAQSLQLQINAKAFARIKLDRIPNTTEQAALLAKEVTSLINELRQVEGRIRQTSPRYAALTELKAPDAAAIQQQLDADTLLLEYSLGPEHSYLWLVSTEGIKSFELPAAKEIERAAARFIEVMHSPTDFYSGNIHSNGTASKAVDVQDEDLVNAVRLSQMLLGPIASQLGQKRLVIVADGILQMLPFAALPDIAAKVGDVHSRPLILRHEIVSLPSISVLTTLREPRISGNFPQKELFVLADPVFSPDDERVKSAAVKKSVPRNVIGPDAKSRERLVGSRTEAEGIGAFVPADKLRTVLDFEANRALLTSGELGQYRYVHLATHGSVNNDHPELTSIVLSLVDEDGNPQDGFFRAHEIYNLKIESELVVLSACDTGKGQLIKGEGLIGLTRGFMYAGARRVVVSLWEIRDESTPRLMVSFYRGMIQESKRPSEALRTAQIEMLNSKKWSAPYYWAPFILQGEWR